MEFLLDPNIWAGFITLVVLEVVLGIDNLVFIAILADKLPPEQRDKARVIGLSLALIMRLALLSVISWLMALTNPLFNIAGLDFSGRDLILLFGGLFLVYKAVSELHENMEGKPHAHTSNAAYAAFGAVVAQIVVLDAVFSLDAVITAVGMVDNIYVMMAAVVVAVAIMLIASKPLTKFVNAHPTVVVLCLSFLLMIGFSLIAEGLGFHIPKGYLYAAMGFAILIEVFNQVTSRNKAKHQAHIPRRLRTTEAVMRIMGGKTAAETEASVAKEADKADFVVEERYMIGGVLTLGERSVASIMTPRNHISWVDLDKGTEHMYEVLMSVPHSLFPVCRGDLDHLVTVAKAKDLLDVLDDEAALQALLQAASKPVTVFEGMKVMDAIPSLRQAKGSLVMVTDEFGSVTGLVTPLDVFEAIAGEFPDADESLDLVKVDDSHYIAKGSLDVYQLELQLGVSDLVDEDASYVNVAGLMLSEAESLPQIGMAVERGSLRFEVESMQDRSIDKVRISRI
ncbi:MAG TPA: transporter associated domain-containing protein [Vitreoscilla sp.]|nr:transporter associated domain-containing protein [Vitreoscilla sp.]